MKVTYLIGAGASANAVPLVTGLKADIHNIRGWFRNTTADSSKLEDYLLSVGMDKDGQPKLIINDILSDLGWLYDIANSHASIDTFAKLLSISSNEGKKGQLKKLKIIFSIYLMLTQKRVPVDKRYENFFASLIDENGVLPSNVRILSWNYDLQVELAYAKVIQNNSLGDVQKLLRIWTKHDRKNEIRGDHFRILKLNGSGAFRGNHGLEQLDYLYNLIDMSSDLYLIDCAIRLYRLSSEKYISRNDDKLIWPLLSFAWNEEIGVGEDFHDIVDRSISETKDSDALVIIGYSFPYFNRICDRRIIEAMGNLKQIYFQDINAENLATTFASLNFEIPTNRITALKDVAYFFVPPEYEGRTKL